MQVFFLIAFASLSLTLQGLFSIENPSKKVVRSIKRFQLKEFPKAFNPSLLKTDEGFLLSFRYCPNPKEPWLSEIGLARLDNRFQLIGKPSLLQTRFEGQEAPPQAEDARIVSLQGRLYLLYNDNVDTFVHKKARRDMFIAELDLAGENPVLKPPVKLVYRKVRHRQRWQKNWVPFIYENELLLAYSIVPHEILLPDLNTGDCVSLHKTQAAHPWRWGPIHGGTQAQLVDGRYLAFFHSNNKDLVNESDESMRIQYYLGAYTFSAEPPFHLTSISKEPLKEPALMKSSRWNRILFPSGFAVDGSNFYLALGKDDCEMLIVTIDKVLLLKSLVQLHQQ